MVTRVLGPRRLSLIAAAAVSVLAAGGLAFSGATAQAASTMSVGPTADSYVNSSAASANYGTSVELRVDGSPTVHSYLRFDLHAVGGGISKATLQIYANSSSSVGFDVHKTGDAWTEAGLTNSTAPAIGAQVGTTGSFGAGAWTAVDVTSAVQTGSIVDFALIDRNSTAINLASRESSNPPKLVLTPVGGATGTATPTAKPSATPPSIGDPILIGAGDICVTSVIKNAQATAALITARPNDIVFTLGDNSNESGTAAQYANCYATTWGAFLNRTRATVGNHDYMTSGAAPYYSYFGAAAGPAGKGYYSYSLANNWHVIVLNAMCSSVGGCGVGSAQETFLRNDLAANAGKHVIAMWHIPSFSSGGTHGNNSNYAAWWQDLYAAHADLVLDGHDHDYERFALQSPSAQADPAGIREFVVGTGGAGQRPMGTIRANSQVRSTGTFGVLELTLGAHSYSWQFIPVAGQTFTDSGMQATHS